MQRRQDVRFDIPLVVGVIRSSGGEESESERWLRKTRTPARASGSSRSQPAEKRGGRSEPATRACGGRRFCPWQRQRPVQSPQPVCRPCIAKRRPGDAAYRPAEGGRDPESTKRFRHQAARGTSRCRDVLAGPGAPTPATSLLVTLVPALAPRRRWWPRLGGRNMSAQLYCAVDGPTWHGETWWTSSPPLS